jgi:hypothetical protein
LRGAPVAIDWIRPLAAPYLRGYRAYPQRRGSLRGFWFVHPAACGPLQQHSSNEAARSSKPAGESSAGFFVGYLEEPTGYEYLRSELPECLVFAFVDPPAGATYRRLVAEPGSLLPKTFEYIRWLTHRPPRFEFHEGKIVVMVRHQSMRAWPVEKYEHLSGNFFIETLAWLVRSALVRKLLTEFSTGHRMPKRSKRELPKKGRRARKRLH